MAILLVTFLNVIYKLIVFALIFFSAKAVNLHLYINKNLILSNKNVSHSFQYKFKIFHRPTI